MLILYVKFCVTNVTLYCDILVLGCIQGSDQDTVAPVWSLASDVFVGAPGGPIRYQYEI